MAHFLGVYGTPPPLHFEMRNSKKHALEGFWVTLGGYQSPTRNRSSGRASNGVEHVACKTFTSHHHHLAPFGTKPFLRYTHYTIALAYGPLLSTAIRSPQIFLKHLFFLSSQPRNRVMGYARATATHSGRKAAVETYSRPSIIFFFSHLTDRICSSGLGLKWVQLAHPN